MPVGYPGYPPLTKPRPEDAELEALRGMIFGDQMEEISRLRERLSHLGQENEVLTERIRLTFLQQNQELVRSLRRESGPAAIEWFSRLNEQSPEERKNAGESSKLLVMTALEQAASSSPGQLARVMTPVLGPTIRSYVKAIFRQLLQQLDAMMRKANVFQRALWRIQALTKGVSYGEFVLMKTTQFSVVHASLSRRESGETVAEAGVDIPDEGEQSPFGSHTGMASAMTNHLHPEWETLRLPGEHFALQVRTLGACPPHIRASAEDILSFSERHLSKQTTEPENGADAAPIPEKELAPIISKLGSLLVNKGKPSLSYGLTALGIILTALAAWGTWTWWKRNSEDKFVQSLSTTPGYLVQKTTEKAGRLQVSGLRDPLAPSPEELLASTGLKADRFQFDFTGFRSLGTPYENSRSKEERKAYEATQQQRQTLLEQLTNMEESRKALVEAFFQESAPYLRDPLKLTWEGQKLVVEGKCPEELLESIKRTADNLAKVVPVDLKVTAESLPPWNIVRKLEATDIQFVSGTTQFEVTAEQAVMEVIKHIQAADALNPDKTTALRLRAWPITGFWQEGNRGMQMERINLVTEALDKAGINTKRLLPSVLEPSVIHARQGVWVEWMSEEGRTGQ